MRLIARLDVKAPNLVKGINYEGLKKLGAPQEYASDYYSSGIDELLFIDIVASLYRRNSLLEIISKTTEEVFVPLTVAGGIRSLADVKAILRAGADKVAVNTAALEKPELINAAADEFGSQCVVGSIQAKKLEGLNWEAYSNNGREKSGRDVVSWACELVERGAGELLISSVDRDGTLLGPDFELLEAISSAVGTPIIASSGFANSQDITRADSYGIDAVALGSLLHFEKTTVQELKSELEEQNTLVRKRI